MDCKWSTTALGKNGDIYRFLIYSLPVMPIIITLFAWLVLYDGNNFAPLPIVLFVIIVVAILSHQWLEILIFIKTARVTAKSIHIKDSKIFLQLFSDKVVEVSSTFFIKDIKIKPDRMLFLKNMKHLALVDGGKFFYISGTTQNFDELHERISEIIDSYSK